MEAHDFSRVRLHHLIFSEIDDVYGYNLKDDKLYVNNDLKSAVIIAKSDIPFTDDELQQLDNYGKLLTDQMKKVRGEVTGCNYYFVKKCGEGDFQCRRRTWDSLRYYDDFKTFFDRYLMM